MGPLENFTEIALNIAAAAAILIAALWLSGFVAGRIRNLSSKRPELDDMLFKFLASLARWAILAIAVIAVLNRFGVQTTSLVALLGAAGLAVGLALQGTLSNLAAGVMLLLFRPFKTGHFIEAAGHSGTVEEISLFTTELTTPDNVQIIIPNNDIWSSSIVNFSAHDRRRADFTFGVSYDTDLKAAEAAIREQVAADDRVHDDPEPFIKVGNLGDSSVDFTVRLWVAAADYWDVKFDMTRKVKEAFDAKGIDIPFPTQLQLERKID
ncbi:mechanosensitive ion channel family protein [Oceanomicrobium pacificus]|uniref:mechanosensitive ion channel family protein n=1 Tax=Oceanomicrobium pacificus TaxID=2692916 RepID=UPI002E2E3873|nr:mechanosensitive ion channel domain-containing protein [Oceanomicrobium pacificus]